MAGRGLTPELVAGLARELDARRGDVVHAAHQDGPGRFRLALRGRSTRRDLRIDLGPGLPRAFLCDAAPAPPAPTPLAFTLRRWLAGARLGGASAVPGERALGLTFTQRGEARTLWLELFGGQANLYLLDADGRVVLTPRGEVAARRGASRGAAFTPVPPRGPPAPEPVPDASRAIARLGEAAHEATDTASLRARVLRFVKRREAAALRTVSALQARLDQEEVADAHRRRGELLRGAFHRLAPGLARVLVPDHTTDPPQEVEVEVDPALSPGEQVAACFRAERRCRRAAAEGRRRLPEARARLEALQEARRALADAGDEEAVRAALTGLPDDVRAQAPLARPAPARGAATPARAQAWRTFRSADGWRILVGRDARGNDRLTLQVARPQDLFLHVRGARGSHVVVPTPRGQSVPKETLLDAAELACVYSERRRAEHNEVDYTPRRYVRKPRGAPPGEVRLLRSRTLTLRRDDARRDALRARRTPPGGAQAPGQGDA